MQNMNLPGKVLNFPRRLNLCAAWPASKARAFWRREKAGSVWKQQHRSRICRCSLVRDSTHQLTVMAGEKTHIAFQNAKKGLT